MSRVDPVQFNIRSAWAPVREDALPGCVPPDAAVQTGRLVRRGPLIVQPSEGRSVSMDEANAALDSERERNFDR